MVKPMSIPYSAELYGESFADVYDVWYDEVSDAQASAAFVRKVCGPGTVLELGVGSGRLADPLVAQGTTVVGVDASMAMLRRCQPSDRLRLLLGDMRDLPFDANRPHFDGVLIGFNTLFNLVTGADQQQLFEDVSKLLRSGGHLIVEATNHNTIAVESDNIGRSSQNFGITRQDGESLVVASTVLDHQTQQIDGCHIECSDSAVTLRPWKLRWSSTEELDLYAERAGLILTSRTADWSEKPFLSDSTNHVSVYQRP